MIGMSEQRLREHLESALVHAMRAEGGVPTIHAIATRIACPDPSPCWTMGSAAAAELVARSTARTSGR